MPRTIPLFAILVLSSCGGSEKQEQETIEGTWRSVAEADRRLELRDGSATLVDGERTYRGRYAIEPATLTFAFDEVSVEADAAFEGGQLVLLPALEEDDSALEATVKRTLAGRYARSGLEDK